jgi:hypothetical protein
LKCRDLLAVIDMMKKFLIFKTIVPESKVKYREERYRIGRIINQRNGSLLVCSQSLL